MEKSDSKKFSELVKSVRELYKAETSNMILRIYWKALCRWEYAVVEKAFEIYTAQKHAFSPNPGDIIAIIEGATDDDAHAAWLAVDKAIADHGPYCRPDFGVDAIHATIRELGGWERMCNMTVSEEPFRRKEFIECFKIHQSRGTSSPGPLSGIQGFSEVRRIELPRQLRKLAAYGKKQITSGIQQSDDQALKAVMQKVGKWT